MNPVMFCNSTPMIAYMNDICSMNGSISKIGHGMGKTIYAFELRNGNRYRQKIVQNCIPMLSISCSFLGD